VARWSLRCVTFQVMSARPGQRPNGLPRDKICQFKLVLLGEYVHVTFCSSLRIFWCLYLHNCIVFDTISYVITIFEMLYTN